jgi:Phosphodiester glycosidase
VTSRRSSLALMGTVGVLVVVLAVRCRSARPAQARADSVVKTVTFRGARFDVVELPLDRWTVRVGWTPGGTRLADVPGAVRTNAGIFEPGFVPTGVLVSGGQTLHALEARDGRGNFFMKPNGVFVVTDLGAAVLETSEYDAGGVREATQSGPLLVRRGVLHPQLNETSNIALLRSGVGVRDGRTVVLVISRDDVNLWTFAALFRDELKCPDALYLDGVISALWAEGAGRDADLEKGPFAGVLTAEPRQLSAP